MIQKGKTRAYDFGLLLKERYSDFLSNSYKSEEIYARTTNKTRTKDTAMLVLTGIAGLRQPVDESIDKYENITGPVHYAKFCHDTLFKLHHCKRYLY